MESHIEILSLSIAVSSHGKAVCTKHDDGVPDTVLSLFKTEYVIVSSVWFFLLVKNYFVSMYSRALA